MDRVRRHLRSRPTPQEEGRRRVPLLKGAVTDLFPLIGLGSPGSDVAQWADRRVSYRCRGRLRGREVVVDLSFRVTPAAPPHEDFRLPVRDGPSPTGRDPAIDTSTFSDPVGQGGFSGNRTSSRVPCLYRYGRGWRARWGSRCPSWVGRTRPQFVGTPGPRARSRSHKRTVLRNLPARPPRGSGKKLPSEVRVNPCLHGARDTGLWTFTCVSRTCTCV